MKVTRGPLKVPEGIGLYYVIQWGDTWEGGLGGCCAGLSPAQ